MRSLFILGLLCLPLKALNITVDYRFDTNGFFDSPEAKAAMEAAAARWSRVIDQTLLPVNIQDDNRKDRRFKLIHPETGENYEMSAAASAKTDLIVMFGGAAQADEYLNGFTLEKDEWILYVGARPLVEAARGGPVAAGVNTTDAFANPNSFINRGFNSGQDSLTVLGGTISFSLDAAWNFDLYNPGGLDFYSIALHEIGHALGLNARGVTEWTNLVSGGRYIGTHAVTAYQQDTGEAVDYLEIENEASGDYHWADNTYMSKIFPLGEPDYLGTVGPGKLQDLLLEPSASFGLVSRRFEITNVEIGGIKDIGWSVISEDPPEGPEIPLKVSRSADGELVLGIPSEKGAVYTIQTSTNGFNWLDVSPTIIGDGTTFYWSDGQEGYVDLHGPASELEAKFYRIKKNEP